MQNKKGLDFYTTNKSSDKINYPLKRKFVFGVIIIIVPILGLLFTWIGFRLSDQAKLETLEKARVIADQVILTRQWVTDCLGGVFVNTKSTGAQGVIYATPDQIVTHSDTYQLFTPSMVTQKLSQKSFEKKDYQFRLSSLTPLNTANQANAFEKNALNRFNHETIAEFFQYTDETFEYMVPLYRSKGCIKCHTQEARQTSSIIGGLRITIPYKGDRQAIQKNILLLAGVGICITLVTVLVLVFLIHTLVLKPINELEEKSRQVSSGDLSCRVNLKTNDELEKLGNSFNLMSESLMHNQDNLEEKVARATHNLAMANNELLKLDKLKSDFLANMSHELRTPLTAVQGSVNYLERTVIEPEQQEFVQIIGKNIARVTRLISNLFEFTKLEAGAIEWEFEREDISQLTKEVIDIMSPLALTKKLTLVQDCRESIFAVIDLERMEQVLVNLLDNAIKFSAIGAHITVGVKTCDQDVEVSITDQGPGIPRENIETIFKKFYTASNGSTQNHQGAGMGLAIAKAIVTAHKGTLSVESREGGSSTFFIRLPISSDTQKDKQDP
ncbi:MAG: ATP-binding protein [Pseudomonadota bacterium]